MTNIEQRLKKYSLYLLGRRAYSTHEMREKIKQKIMMVDKVCKVHKVYKEQNANSLNSSVIPDLIRDPESMTENVVAYLESLNLLNDDEFAKSFTESLLRQKKSTGVIQRKLMQKGISKDIIASVLKIDGERESEILKKLIESKTRNHPELLTTPKGKQKLIRFLMYRGFKYNNIKKIMSELI